MKGNFLKHLEFNNLFDIKDKILLAVSGGIDSMAMLHLFHSENLNFAVAHCNFHLREKESDADQKFVQEFAQTHSIPFFTIDFQTKEYAQSNGISIQIAARELRYNWFEKIRSENKFDYIATAHNKNDTIETFFINLLRGSGISGLSGISVKRDNIIRPLLYASRNEIEQYIQKNNIPFREDSSNKETKYLRNYLRHNIIPELDKINPAYSDKIHQSIQILGKTERVYKNAINNIKNQLCSVEKDKTLINIDALNSVNDPDIYLYEIIKEYGFNFTHTSDILNTLEHCGKTFFSTDYVLLVDRKYIIITKQANQETESYIITDIDSQETRPFNFSFNKISIDDFKLGKSSKTANLDFSRIKFPLTIRKWKDADKFRPLGMKGTKKVSDFLTDKKVDLISKQNTWVLCHNDQIIWLIGHRIDDRYKITPSTNVVLVISI